MTIIENLMIVLLLIIDIAQDMIIIQKCLKILNEPGFVAVPHLCWRLIKCNYKLLNAT